MTEKVFLDRKELECAIAGRYQIADGRDFWIDGVVARTISYRIAKAMLCKQERIEAQQPHEHDWRYASLYTKPGLESRARCQICDERKWDAVSEEGGA